MAKPRLTGGDIGAWVLKGNPQDTWDYFEALEDEGRKPGDVVDEVWTVSTTYRTHLMAKGDLFVLWITGIDRPGIWEIGTITGIAKMASGIDETYLIDQSRARRASFVVPYESVLLKRFVPREDMKNDPILAGCEQFRIPVISNPTYLTPDERDALLHYVPRSMLKSAGWPQRRK